MPATYQQKLALFMNAIDCGVAPRHEMSFQAFVGHQSECGGVLYALTVRVVVSEHATWVLTRTCGRLWPPHLGNKWHTAVLAV